MEISWRTSAANTGARAGAHRQSEATPGRSDRQNRGRAQLPAAAAGRSSDPRQSATRSASRRAPAKIASVATISPSARRIDTSARSVSATMTSVVRYAGEPSDNRRVDNRRHEPMRLEPPGHDGVHGLVVWRETTLDSKLRPDASHEVARCSGLGECTGQGQNRRASDHRDERGHAPAQCVHTSQRRRKHLERHMMQGTTAIRAVKRLSKRREQSAHRKEIVRLSAR